MMTMTGYESDVRRIEDDLAAMLRLREGTVGGMTPDAGGDSRLFFRRFQLLALKGEMSAFAAFDAELDAAIAASRQATDLRLLKVHVALKRHRFDVAGRILTADAALQDSHLGMLLQSDVDFQLGRYAAARTAIEEAVERDATWDALARLAYVTSVFGDVKAADELYGAAEDELTAKQMQTFAWLQLQRGAMYFQRGRHDDALRFYERAESAYSGYWLTQERLAELTGAEGRFTDAISAYERLYETSPRPAWAHAVADLHALSGDMDRAANWQQQAYEGYLAPVQLGEVYELHALVDLCCELAGHAQEAIAWARRDVALRGNYMTQADLAWALYRNGETTEALQWIEAALSSGAVSGRMFLQAACIFAAAGLRERSDHCTVRLREVNPLPARAQVKAPQMRVTRWTAAEFSL